MPYSPVLDWQSTDERGQYVATYVASVGTSDIAIQTGSAFNGDQKITPRWMLIDNLSNNANVNIVFGPFNYTVPRYQREVFKLPVPLASVRVTVTVGTVGITLAENPEALRAGSDQFAIQQAANQFVSYEWLTKSAGGAQLTTDQNFNLLLTNATAQNYALLPSATPVPNGYYNPIVKNAGAGRWSLTPNGADQINSLYTSAIPLQMSQYDSISLSFDGAQWQASGRISFDSGQRTYTSGGALTIAHGLGRAPTEWDVYMECVTANLGYSVGMRVNVPQNADDTARDMVATVVMDATNINVRYNSGGFFSTLANFTTGARASVTVNSWRFGVKTWIDL